MLKHINRAERPQLQESMLNFNYGKRYWRCAAQRARAELSRRASPRCRPRRFGFWKYALLKKKYLSKLEKCYCHILFYGVYITIIIIVDALFNCQLIVDKYCFCDYIFIVFSTIQYLLLWKTSYKYLNCRVAKRIVATTTSFSLSVLTQI